LGIIDVGYGGNKRKRDDPKEFYSLNPEYVNGITYQKYGRAEPFDAGSLALDKTPLKARWFKIEDDATQVVCDLKSQVEIILDAMGDDSVNMSGSSRIRRKEKYLAFYFGRDDGGYARSEIPIIAYKYYNQLRAIFKSPQKGEDCKHVRFCPDTNQLLSVKRSIFVESELNELESTLRLMFAMQLEQGKLDLSNQQWVHAITHTERGARVTTLRSLTPPSIQRSAVTPATTATTATSSSNRILSRSNSDQELFIQWSNYGGILQRQCRRGMEPEGPYSTSYNSSSQIFL
jgi:hypothetical protein